jgi:hypothetical protein
MKIEAFTKEFLKVVSYRVEDVPEVGTVIYTEYYNENDRIVDTVIRTEDGYDIDVPSILEEVQNFVNEEMNVKI